jgi:hypothetical protein
VAEQRKNKKKRKKKKEKVKTDTLLFSESCSDAARMPQYRVTGEHHFCHVSFFPLKRKKNGSFPESDISLSTLPR